MRVLFFIFLLPLFAHAKTWNIQGKQLKFLSVDGFSLANCEQGKHSKCLAYKIMKAISLKAETESPTDANPTALLCKGVGGLSLIGTDEKKNENSFCEFKDGSIVSASDLYASAIKNSKTK